MKYSMNYVIPIARKTMKIQKEPSVTAFAARITMIMMVKEAIVIKNSKWITRITLIKKPT